MSQIKVITLLNSKGTELQISNFGATIIGLKVPDKNNELVDVVVSLEKPSDYIETSHPSLGSSIGRYAGRISNGKFTVEGEDYPIYNEEGVHLHGGKIGFDKRFWKVEDVSGNKNSKVILSIESKHLDEGYPGNLNTTVCYQLTEENEVKITYKATSDRPTPVSLTNHAYYNLDGEGSILNHYLMVNTTHCLEFSNQLLPSGKLIPTDGNRFNKKKLMLIGKEDFIGFDNAFVLSEEKLKAVLSSEKSGIKMEMYTNQPVGVVYTPIEFDVLPFKKGVSFSKFSAICFEPQNFPDAPNNNNFPSSILNPGEEYINESVFKFSLV